MQLKIIVLKLNGYMNKKFDFILLPPDGFHQTFDDLLSKSNQIFLNLEKNIKMLSKKEKKSFVVKYRNELQQKNFPCLSNYIVSYGNLLNYCHKKTIVIGPCGTAVLEVLKNNVQYYSYDFFQAFKKNRMIHNDFTSILYVAKTNNELIDNIKKKKIFKSGFKFENLIFTDGISLDKIIKKVLNF